MLLTDFTTYAEIRAALGVSEDELEDSTLALDLYAQSLLLELKDISADLPADFAEIAAIDEGTRTDAQANVYAAVRVFAPYAVAVQLASGVALFSAKTITDGKASVTRDSNSPYATAIEECRVNYARFRALLLGFYGALTSAVASTTLRPFLSVVSPATDPVTGA